MELPLILAGPILRRVDPATVAVWMAFSEPADLELRVWEGRVAQDTTNPVFVSSEDPPDPSAPPPRPGAETIRIGEHLHLGLVTARIPPASGKVFQPDRLYSYDVIINAGGEVLGLGERGLLATRTVNGVQVPPLGYDDRMLPSFALPPSELDHLRIAYGSCRRPGYDDGDALAWIDDLLVTSVGDPRARIHQLFLGGDQIYADDVDSVMMLRVVELGIELIGTDGDTGPPIERVKVGKVLRLPAGTVPDDADPTASYTAETAAETAAAGDLPAGAEHFPVGQRLDVTQRNAQLTSIDGSNHVISFGEFAALHLMVWSPAVWGELVPGAEVVRVGDTIRSQLRWLDAPTELGPMLFPEVGFPPLEYPTRIPEHLYADKATLAKRHPPESAEEKEKRERKEARSRARSHRVHRDFLLGLGKVQRVLANVPTYMMFDDHDLTDDLFLSPMWRHRVLGATLGQVILTNGMLAYALFQDWGNDPRRYDQATDASRPDLGGQLPGDLLVRAAGYFPAGQVRGPDPATFTALATMFGHNLDNTPDLDGRYRAVRPPLTWHFTVDGPKHRVVALDNRTRRSYAAEIGPPGNVSPEALVDQLPLPPLPAGREVLIVVAPLQVIGPGLLDEVVSPAIYRIFDLVKAGERTSDTVSGSRRMPGTNPDALETWSLEPLAYEHLLERLAEYQRVVLLSGDVHNSTGNLMSYWRGPATNPARIAQFTSSGMKNVMPVYLRALDRSAMLLQELLRARLGVERFGWDRPADDLVLLPEGRTEDDLVAATRSKLLRSPVLLPAHGWLDDNESGQTSRPELTTRLNPAHPPDWRWRVQPLLDGRADAERPSPIRARAIDDAAVEAQLADPAQVLTALQTIAALPPVGAGPDAQRPPDAVPVELRRVPVHHRGGRRDHCHPRAVHVGARSGDAAAGSRSLPGPGGAARTGRRAPAGHAAGAGDRARPHPGGALMSEKSTLQRLAGWAADVAGDIADLFVHQDVREAVLADLGGKPGSAGAFELPAVPLEAVRQYRDAVDPDAQADAEAIGNIAILLGAAIDQIEAWDADWPSRGDAFAYGLLDILASTHIRRASPKLFLVLQAIASTVELTETHGPGERGHARFLNAFASIFSFVWNPGRTLDDLDDTVPGASGSTLNTARDTSFLVVDGIIRGLVAALAVIDQVKDDEGENVLGDVIVGWDAAALDVDSPARPTAADVVSGRMVSVVLRRGGGEDEQQVRLSWLYLPRRLGTPERPHQLFLALGGELTLDQVLNRLRPQEDPEWHFRVDVRSDAGAAWLISGDDSQASATADTSQVSVGWAAIPNETGVSYAVPGRTGSRLELGGIAAVLTLSGAGARVLFRFDKAAVVIDGASSDGFMRKLLGGRPIRRPLSAALGYDSQLGFIYELHTPSSTDAAGVQPPFDSSGPAGPPTVEMTLPLGGGGLLGINVHEIVLRAAGRKAEAPESGIAVALGVLVSFSTQIGPVYLRVDQLGLQARADTMTPPEDRNLRVLQAGVGAEPPRGIAVHVETGPVSGGGSIQHDPATGDYVGVLVLRLGKRVTITCIGLVSPGRPGADESSLILIGTVEHLDLQAGFVTFDGFGLIYVSDRRLDVEAVRRALPTGQLRHILFPADPVKHVPELVSALRTFFPVQRGTHSYGILVKLFFGAGHPIIRADLALLLERDSVADRSRLLVLGRISSALPQDKDAVLRLNLDVVGVFDLDSGEMSVDAVLYESKLCGRFVLTGAAAFRRAKGQGFALAVGGFNPRFRPPTGFPVVPRVTVALTTGDNPKLIVEAYFALTSNTVQFGARASLYAAAYGFSIEGYVGFDVLIQLWPPHFLADFQAGVQLKRGSRNLFKVDVKGTLEGPIPLRVAGKATFGILWWDYTVGFDRVLVGGSGAVVTESLDVVTEVLARLENPTSWRSELPPAAAQLVGLRSVPAGDALLLHPLGRLEVRQGVVPLRLDRDIDRVGAFVPSGERRFAITSASVGGSSVDTDPVFDDFPDGQFFDMTDAQRLAAPAFVRREAGVAFGGDEYRTDTVAAVASPVGYTEIVVGPDGVPVTLPAPQPPPPHVFDAGLRISAAARAATRTSQSERYTEPALAGAPRLDDRWRQP